MKKATDKAVQILAEMSQPVAGKEQIAKVAAVSSGSEEVGQMVADAMEKVSKDGVITIEESKTMQNELELVEGMQFDRGYISAYMCTEDVYKRQEIAISPETILEELGVKKAGTKRAAPRPRYGKEAEMVLKTLAAEPQNLAQLAGSTGIPLQELTGILLALEIDGVIAENPPGVYMALS